MNSLSAILFLRSLAVFHLIPFRRILCSKNEGSKDLTRNSAWEENQPIKTLKQLAFLSAAFVSSRNAPPQQGGVLRDETKMAARETKKQPETVGKTGDQG